MRAALLSNTSFTIETVVKAMLPHVVAVCRDREALASRIEVCDVLIVQNKGFPVRVVDATILAQASELRLIQHCGVSHDGTDVDAARRRGIAVATTSNTNSQSVAELGFYLLLSAAKRARAAERRVQTGVMGDVLGVELSGKTLCVVGFGPIGRRISKMAKAVPMRVIVVRRSGTATKEDLASVDAVYRSDQLGNALRDADFVLLALPLNASTTGIMGADQFKAMKIGASLINISRGAHVRREALVWALNEGRLATYASDVYWHEPAPPDDPLVKDERVTITPHIGADTFEANQRMARAVRENIDRWLRGDLLENRVA
jgi:D-3-phosphoglycerate dehydrogenase